jgi:hypothetical protein
MIIGLIGLKGSGKDTLANCVQYDRENTYILKFAKGIKDILKKYFNITEDYYEDPILKEIKFGKSNKTIRDLMIFIGVNFRVFDKDIWVNKLDEEIKYLNYDSINYDYEKEDIYLITDVRFPNEIQYIKSQGGIIIDIDRKNLYYKEKKIVKIFGHNFISKFLIYFINKNLTKKSEWLYFKNKKDSNFYIDNTNLDIGVNELRKILSKI